MFYALTVLAALSRLLPHPPNFAPIGALGLFTGANSSKRFAWALPLVALLASDLFLGLYHPVLMAFVYGGFAVSGWLGRRFLRERRSGLRVAGCSLAGSVAFFVLSNFGCWLVGMYPRTPEGLVTCYAMALPFFRNTLLGDLFYSVALLGLYELAMQRQAKRQNVGSAA